MKRQSIVLATGLALAVAAPIAAKPTVHTAVQRADWRVRTIEGGLADGTGTAAEDTIRLVKKGDKNDKKANKNNSRPPGWDKGNKTGWGGRNVPPGQAKKNDRNDRNDRDYRDDRDGRNTTDRNRNGIPDWRERDTDRDGIPDYRERTSDRDRDGIPDYRDRNTDRNRGDGFIDRNRNGVDDRRENRNGGTNSNILFGTISSGARDNNRDLTVRLDNGGTRTYTLQRDASIVQDGRAISLRDLRNGDRVQMRVVSGNRVTSMVVY